MLLSLLRTTHLSSLKVSCTFTVKDKTIKEFVKIQSALNIIIVMKTEVRNETDGPATTANELTFKKPISCLTCGKSFNRADTLKTHEIIHTGEKPFSCLKCEKNFTTPSSLKTHERIHTGEKPFRYSQCDHKCARSSYWITHERTHTGDKPFSCSKCDKNFSQVV